MSAGRKGKIVFSLHWCYPLHVSEGSKHTNVSFKNPRFVFEVPFLCLSQSNSLRTCPVSAKRKREFQEGNSCRTWRISPVLSRRLCAIMAKLSTETKLCYRCVKWNWWTSGKYRAWMQGKYQKEIFILEVIMIRKLIFVILHPNVMTVQSINFTLASPSSFEDVLFVCPSSR